MSEKTFSVDKTEFIEMSDSKDGRQYLNRLRVNRAENIKALRSLMERLRKGGEQVILNALIPMCIYDLLLGREFCRSMKHYDEADEIRKAIESEGVEINDMSSATIWNIWGYENRSYRSENGWKYQLNAAKPVEWEAATLEAKNIG